MNRHGPPASTSKGTVFDFLTWTSSPYNDDTINHKTIQFYVNMFIWSHNTLKSFSSGYMYMYDNELLLILTAFSLSPRLRSRWSTCHWGLWGWTVSWLSLTPHCPVLAARITDRPAPHSSTAHWKNHKTMYMYNTSILNMMKVHVLHDFWIVLFKIFLLLIKTLPGT